MKISSKSEYIPINESKTFKLKFLAKRIGKFIEQAFFKVKNGDRLSFAIEGLIRPLEIEFFPRTIDFPMSSICVPQVCTLHLKNELPFDVKINIESENDGCENPLEFVEFFKSQIDSVDESSSGKLSPTIESQKSSTSHLTRTSVKSILDQCEKSEQLRDLTSDGIAAIFNKVNDYMASKEIAGEIIQNLFTGEDFNYDIEKRFVAETMLEVIMETVREADYTTCGFEKFNKKTWIFPAKPRQIECDKNSFQIISKTSTQVKIFLTSNFLGKFTRNLKLFVEMSDAKCNVEKTIVNIPIASCTQAGHLKIQEQTIQTEGYAENEISLEILVENVSPVDGFFTTQTIHDEEMEIRCEEEKFHVQATSKKILKFLITPLKSGEILKHVHIVALGSNKKFPIYIDCKSLPPNVVIKPGRICEQELDVLVKHDTRIFIENRSMTKARFFIKLEHDRECFSVNPSGGILSSNQCVMVMLEKLFHDPGDYRDVLIVEVLNCKIFVSLSLSDFLIRNLISLILIENSNQMYRKKTSNFN